MGKKLPKLHGSIAAVLETPITSECNYLLDVLILELLPIVTPQINKAHELRVLQWKHASA